MESVENTNSHINYTGGSLMSLIVVQNRYVMFYQVSFYTFICLTTNVETWLVHTLTREFIN